MLHKPEAYQSFFSQVSCIEGISHWFYTSIDNHYLRHNNHHLLYYDKHDMTMWLTNEKNHKKLWRPRIVIYLSFVELEHNKL